MMVSVRCWMMVSVRKVLHDGGLSGRSCIMVSVRTVLHDGVC